MTRGFCEIWRRSRTSVYWFLLIMLMTPFVCFATEGPSKETVAKRLPALSVPFVANEGQIDGNVAYFARTFAGTVYVTKSGALCYVFPGEDVPSGVREEVVSPILLSPRGEEPSAARIGFFRGNDPAKWKGNLPSFNLISLGEITPGVTLSLKAHGNNVEKLFVVKPGTSPHISMKFSGIEDLSLTDSGELRVITGSGSFTFTKPIAYQEIEGKRREVMVAYMLPEEGSPSSVLGPESNAGNGTYSVDRLYSFVLGPYDTTKPLVIDPLLAGTYLGGSSDDGISSIALDAKGNVFVAGSTYSRNFPSGKGAYDRSLNDARDAFAGGDAFIAKLDSSLSTLVAATYFGGRQMDSAGALSIDSSGNVLVTGVTESPNFPVTKGAYDTTPPPGLPGYNRVFVSKFNDSLSALLTSTFAGDTTFQGTNDSSWVAPSFVGSDGSGNIYAGGGAGDLRFASPSRQWGFIFKFNESLTNLVAETALTGRGNFSGSFVLDSSGNVYAAGSTSLESPIVGAADPYKQDVYIAKFDASLALMGSYYLGGNGDDRGSSIAVDQSGKSLFVAGSTYSSDFPTTKGVCKGTGAMFDLFVIKLDSALTTILSSTCLGQSQQDISPVLLGLSPEGDVYVAAENLPAPPLHHGYYGRHAFVSKLDNDLSSILKTAYVGGTGWDDISSLIVDPSGGIYIAGTTYSNDFPATENAFSRRRRGYSDGFIAKLDSDLSPPPYPLIAIVGGFQGGKVSGEGLKCESHTRIPAFYGSSGYSCSGLYPEGTAVTVAAKADRGSVFTGWTNCDAPAGDKCVMTVTVPKLVQANFAANPVISVSPANLLLGRVRTGESSTGRIVVKNKGAGILLVRAISLNGGENGFAVTNQDCQAGGVVSQCTIEVTFTPTSSGAKTGEVVITSNDPLQSTAKVRLTGRAVDKK